MPPPVFLCRAQAGEDFSAGVSGAKPVSEVVGEDGGGEAVVVITIGVPVKGSSSGSCEGVDSAVDTFGVRG